jgi:4-alpha-glucanotransferase
LFQLDRDGRPVAVTGVPPDLFSADGQLWNHPQYKWAAHKKEGYGWWVRRFEAMARHFDAVRIDHFLGFQRAWAIPAGAKNARKGRWQLGPQDEIFKVVKKRMGEYPIIAEDLGVLTPEAAALRDRQGFPGMRVLQFGFGGGDWGGEMYLPHGYVKRCVAYTGTHDNPTTVGWFKALPRKSAERAAVLEYLGAEAGTVHWDMIRAVMTSVADTAIFPVQDLLGLDDRARMNRPGVDRGNWQWQLKAGELSAAIVGRLRRLTEISGRV